MSDFDEVLERLVVDPAFASALAADPASALSGYALSDDEVALLHSQVGADDTTQHGVEVRANQSSTFGLLGSFGGLLAGGGGIGIGDQLAHPGQTGLGHAPDAGAGGGASYAASGPAEASGLGSAATEGFGSAASAGMGAGYEEAASFGPYAQAEGTHGGEGGLSGFGDEIGQRLQETPPHGTAGFGGAPPVEPPVQGPPEGYHTRVDVDGDGDWDKHVVIGRSDGGVDILIDNDGDGRVDFVGHDTDADGLVNSADYDKDGDGFFEKTMYDDDGDGWMDRTVPHHP